MNHTISREHAGAAQQPSPWAEGLPASTALLLPRKRHPYYIVAPTYVRTSAGIRVLHLLCNALNRLGENAYLVIHPYMGDPHKGVHPYLDTPLLDAQRMLQHHEDGLCPITIYPETVRGNPFDAPLVVRYLLNFPGLLGGDEHYPEDEVMWAYSEAIAQGVDGSCEVLFFPVSDPEQFTPFPPQPRKGSCFYGAKYQAVHGGELFEVTRDSVEITRDLPDSPTPAQIADLFRRSEVFYCYENSALAIEALLCECPVVFLPNPYLERMIGFGELGTDGIAWGTDADQLERARATVRQARRNYLRLYDVLEQRLHALIAQTQAVAGTTTYERLMHIESIQEPGMAARLASNWEVLRHAARDQGLPRTLLRVLSYVRRKGLRLK